MSPDALLLGLVSAVRATSLAVVYALLLAPNPRRLLGAYTAAGLTLSLAVGIAVVTWFDATAGSSQSDTVRQVIELVVGIGALSYAAGYLSGRVGQGKPEPPGGGPAVPSGALGERLARPTVGTAALAGAVTNLPGLFYIAALAAILETQPGPVNGVLQVVVYNALRFAVPLAALTLVIVRPERTHSIVDAVRGWGQRHRRTLIVAVFGSVGVYLTAKGLLGLFD